MHYSCPMNNAPDIGIIRKKIIIKKSSKTRLRENADVIQTKLQQLYFYTCRNDEIYEEKKSCKEKDKKDTKNMIESNFFDSF